MKERKIEINYQQRLNIPCLTGVIYQWFKNIDMQIVNCEVIYIKTGIKIMENLYTVYKSKIFCPLFSFTYS